MNGKIRIRRVYKATELKRFKQLEGEYHHMGETHSGGDTMRIVFEAEDGEWLALMVWGSAVYHLRPRDEYIGWNMALRAARQKLVVNNRRFTVLARPGSRPNLASQCLGLAMRELPRMWLEKFRYRPLLAETFCDVSHSSGTCYRAANWIPLGMTRGFTRVNRQECDFYIPNDSPKTIWVAPFVRDAVELLNSPDLPDECLEGARCDADGVLPVSPRQAESLYEAMRRVRDWRDDNKSIPAAAMLSIVVMAMMGGANSVKAVWRFGERLTMAQRRLLCLRHDRDRFGRPLKAYFKVPSYVTFYKFLRKLDLADFGERLSAWLQSQEGTLPRRLALDGKFVKDVMGVVSMADCETGAPVAVAASRRKEWTVGECELPKGQKLIRGQDLTNALVCADALHGQQETARDILNANGNYLLQIKGNQATILRNAESLVKARKPTDAKKK